MKTSPKSIKEISELLDAVNLEKKQKKAIFEIIDLKVRLDMEEILYEMQSINSSMNQKLSSIEQRIKLRDTIFYFLFYHQQNGGGHYRTCTKQKFHYWQTIHGTCWI